MIPIILITPIYPQIKERNSKIKTNWIDNLYFNVIVLFFCFEKKKIQYFLVYPFWQTKPATQLVPNSFGGKFVLHAVSINIRVYGSYVHCAFFFFFFFDRTSLISRLLLTRDIERYTIEYLPKLIKVIDKHLFWK